MFETKIGVRAAKVALLVSFGLMTALVVLGNVVDPQTNFGFVEHVLRMDTTFEGSALRGRAIESGVVHRLVFGLIVAGEAVVSALCLWGSFRLVRVFRGDSAEFHAAKGPGLWALTGALAIWFLGFQVVGGEWFASWQSESWNGLDSAARISTFALGSLIFLSLPND